MGSIRHEPILCAASREARGRDRCAGSHARAAFSGEGNHERLLVVRTMPLAVSMGLTLRLAELAGLAGIPS
jgi:hypothetical protein